MLFSSADSRPTPQDSDLLRRQDTREKIAKGYDSLRLGKGVDGDTVFERIVMELRAIDSKRSCSHG
jgi:hypothetical protein